MTNYTIPLICNPTPDSPLCNWFPSIQNIVIGDTVTWTAFRGTHAIRNSGGSTTGCYSAPVPGSCTFTATGIFSYFCYYHPSEVGTIIVTDSLPSPPSTSGLLPTGIPIIPTIPISTSPLDAPWLPANWISKSWGGVVQPTILAHVINPAQFNMQSIMNIPGVHNAVYYNIIKKLVVVPTNALFKPGIMSALNSTPGIGWSEDDYSLSPKGCTDGTPCFPDPNHYPLLTWLSTCKVPQAWCRYQAANQVYFFDAGGTPNPDFGLENLTVIPTTQYPEARDGHGNMQAIYAIGTGGRNFCVPGAGKGNAGIMYTGQSDQNSLVWGGYWLNSTGNKDCWQRCYDDVQRERQHIYGGDVFVDHGVTALDAPWIWAAGASVVAGVNYTRDVDMGFYPYLASSWSDNNGVRRDTCRKGAGLFCVIPDSGEEPVDCTTHIGGYCNSSAAGPALAGLLSMRTDRISSGMQRVNALARSCSNFPNYSEENGFGIPDACKYLDNLDDIINNGKTFAGYISLQADESFTYEPSQQAYLLWLIPQQTGWYDTYSTAGTSAICDVQIRAQIASPDGDITGFGSWRGNYPMSYLTQLPPNALLLKGPNLGARTTNDIRSYRRRYIIGGRVGYNIVYGYQEFGGRYSYVDAAGNDFWPFQGHR